MAKNEPVEAASFSCTYVNVGNFYSEITAIKRDSLQRKQYVSNQKCSSLVESHRGLSLVLVCFLDFISNFIC